jgi:hypothetical protein
MPRRVGDTHFQNSIASGIWCALSLVLLSRLKICRLSPGVPAVVALSAMTFLSRHMMAESAVICLRSGVIGDARSTITSVFCAPVSRMVMYLSLSKLTLRKVRKLSATPMLESCRGGFGEGGGVGGAGAGGAEVGWGGGGAPASVGRDAGGRPVGWGGGPRCESAPDRMGIDATRPASWRGTEAAAPGACGPTAHWVSRPGGQRAPVRRAAHLDQWPRLGRGRAAQRGGRQAQACVRVLRQRAALPASRAGGAAPRRACRPLADAISSLQRGAPRAERVAARPQLGRAA